MQVVADMILIDGQVLTMDEADTVAQAVAVCKGKVIVVRESRAIAQMAGRRTEQINLAGRTLLPGFIDAHTHNDIYGMMTSDLVVDCHIPPLQSVDDILKAIALPTAYFMNEGPNKLLVPKTEKSFMFRTMLDMGLCVAGNSDGGGAVPEAPNPMYQIWCMVNRRSLEGGLARRRRSPCARPWACTPGIRPMRGLRKG